MLPRPISKATESARAMPFVAPDGLRFERATRSWQPYVDPPSANRRRRMIGDIVFVTWAGSLIVAMVRAVLWPHF
jgi:hypothetical protein